MTDDAHDAALEALGIDKKEHEEAVRKLTWDNLCPACKGYPQEHIRDGRCFEKFVAADPRLGENRFECLICGMTDIRERKTHKCVD